MKRWIYNVLIVIFALIFLVSAYLLCNYYKESSKQKQEFNELAQIMASSAKNHEPQMEQAPTAPLSSGSPEESAPVSTEPALVEVADPESGEPVLLLPEFADLYQLNNDIVGWIQIEDSFINYPVMQTPDYTDYYLYRSFAKEYSNHGCIYVREVCDVFAPSDNITIYGHRMGDGTMFNSLHNYDEESYYKEHPYIIFNTLMEHHTYQIMAVFRISSSVGTDFPYHLFVDAADEAHFDEYVQNCLSRSLYDTGVTATYGDKLITLSTCEYTNINGRFVVVAKRIS